MDTIDWLNWIHEACNRWLVFNLETWMDHDPIEVPNQGDKGNKD